MSPDQNKTGMTVSGLLQMAWITSFAIPLATFILLSVLVIAQITSNVLLFAIIGCAVVVLLGIIIVINYVQRNIKERIQSLADICREYSGGDRTVRAPVNGDDEFAQLSMTINALLDSQGAMPHAQLGGGGDAAALQAQIEKLLQEVSAVGDGDLRVQAEVTPDTLGVLADSFNYMIEELAKVVGRVQSTAVQVTNATRRVLDRSAELAQMSDAQAKQIAQTSEAVEALATFIQNVARNAQLSVEVAQEALRNASNGQQAVRQTIEGMLLIRENVQETSKKIKRLGERSNEIGEIVRIIEDIADQTNLLALNAAIQSAMAGEHGRGFAVVADEIRLLAERSTESTKRIATLVKSIQGDTYEAVVAMEDSTQEVVKGSQLADEAGRSLNSIYEAVERQAQMIESIARSANEQTSVSEAVAVAMSRISEITRQTDAGTQEAALSVSYLAELSEQLRSSVSTFRLPERVNEEMGSLPSRMTSVSEVAESGNVPPAFSPALDGAEWGQGFSGQGFSQNFSGSFPPLPEPGSSGSLVSMGSRGASLPGVPGNFAHVQDINQLPQPAFGGPSDFGAPSSLPFAAASSPDFGGQQGFAAPPPQAVNGNPFAAGRQQFAGQGALGEFGNLEGEQQGFNNAGWYGGQGQQFGGAPPQFGNPGPASPPMNSGLLPPPPQSGQSVPPMPRQPQPPQQRKVSGPQQQNQGPFYPEQRPFRDA